MKDSYQLSAISYQQSAIGRKRVFVYERLSHLKSLAEISSTDSGHLQNDCDVSQRGIIRIDKPDSPFLRINSR
jgi:hypothetical protein